MPLTDLAIRSLPFQEEGQKDHSDDQLAGFFLRVGVRTKTFMLSTGTGKQRKRHTLGQYPHLSLSEARQKAKITIGEFQRRKHEPGAVPFKEAYARYLEAYKLKNRPRTVDDLERYFKHHMFPTFEHKNVEDMTRARLVAIFDGIESTAVGHHFYAVAHTFFKWCRRYGLQNPLDGVEKPPKPKARTRLLTDDEFRAVWRASYQMGTYGRCLRTFFSTGQRRTQIAHLHSDWIDRDGRVIRFPAEIMKTRREHVLPYGPLTASLLSNDTGLQFPTARGGLMADWDTWKRTLDKLAPIAHWVHHDGRRFYSSTHAKIGTPRHIREMLLSHTRPAGASEVETIYDRYDYLEEKRTAQLAYECHIAKLLEAA